MRRPCRALRASTGIFSAIVTGLLAGLSQPLVLAETPLDPTGLSGLLALVALIPLLLVLPSVSPGRAFFLGFVASWVQLVIIAHWVVFAFAVAGAGPLISVPAMLVCGAVLALIPALAWWAARRVSEDLHWPLWVIFPPALAAAELLRNYLPFGGDPWGNLGMSMASIGLLRQGASLAGVYGLVLLVALVNALLAEVLAKRSVRHAAALAGVLVLWCGWGALRLSTEAAPERTVKVGILQASIPQQLINDPSGRFDQMRAPYHRLQARAIEAGAELVVWPETALLPVVERGARSLAEAGVLPSRTATAPAAAIIGSGAMFYAQRPGRGPMTYLHNSAFATGRGLEVVGRFDKLRLVPFGEYVPWPFDVALERLVTAEYELLPGTEARPVKIPLESGEITAGVTICWDGAFPEISRAFADRGAELMFNLTNDGWYGVSSEPYQHLAMYAMRATETARPVVRAANTGISAWIDGRGRIHDAAPIFREALIVADVPLSSERTPYLSIGELVPAAGGALVAVALVLGILRRRRARASHLPPDLPPG